MAEYRIVPIQRADLTEAVDSDDVTVDVGSSYVEMINTSAFDVLYSVGAGAQGDWVRLSGRKSSPAAQHAPNRQKVDMEGETLLQLRGLFNLRDLNVVGTTTAPVKLALNVIPQTVIVNEVS